MVIKLFPKLYLLTEIFLLKNRNIPSYKFLKYDNFFWKHVFTRFVKIMRVLSPFLLLFFCFFSISPIFNLMVANDSPEAFIFHPTGFYDVIFVEKIK